MVKNIVKCQDSDNAYDGGEDDDGDGAGGGDDDGGGGDDGGDTNCSYSSLR